MSKTVILACPTLKLELEEAIRRHDSDATVYFMPRQLHNDPRELHRYVQDMVDHFSNVERIVLCVSRCGGGTAHLHATTAPLILPRTRDCLDILLSGDSLRTLQRNIRGIFFTASWMEFSRNSELDLGKLTEKMGREGAEEYLRRVYKTFNEFYIIDTGCYDVREVEEYLTPLVKILKGTITVLRGEYNILHKMAQETFDEDFVIGPRGAFVPAEAFLPNR